MLNALTIDVEDYFQVSAFEDHIPRDEWDGYPSRVVSNTHRLLDLLDEHKVRGTFYVLGWVAHRFPGLAHEIRQRGHELGSHSYWHRLVYRMTPGEFRDDLRQSLAALEDAAGERVKLYRAPSFSITRQSLWALDILAEEGIRCDSSVFPIHHDRYGIPNAKRCIHSIDTSIGSVCEFPPSVVRFAGMNFPVSGGGYFRLYPLTWTCRALAHVNRRDGQPFMFYIHPWELDPEQPRLNCGSRTARFRHYLHLRSTRSKLCGLLERFEFGTVSEAIEANCAKRSAGAPAVSVDA
jgi:polysaccharide deacetylase family protein (PEP-CTERM system associated)